MIYLSCKTLHYYEYGPEYFGCMFNAAYRTHRQFDALEDGVWWMLDNGIFSGKWTLDRWSSELEQHAPYRATCLGVPVPDKVADWQTTVRRFHKYKHIPRSLGLPAAFVSQDGLPLSAIPWAEFDTLFIGGSDSHKRGPEAYHLGMEAQRRGKWIHIGRVNSGRAGAFYWPWADSWDGTTLAFHPTQQVESIIAGVRLCNRDLGHQPPLPLEVS